MSHSRPKVLISNPSGRSVAIEHSNESGPKRKKPAGQGGRKNKAARTTTFQVQGSLQTESVAEPSAGLSRSTTSQTTASIPPASIPPASALEENLSPENGEGTQQETVGAKKQNANYYLRQWKEKSTDQYLHSMYNFDAPPAAQLCQFCQTPTESFHRCVTCLGFSTSCQTCLLTSHRNLPTHHIQVWNGSFWEKTSVSSLGHVLELGHSGQRCPLSPRTDELWVGDLLGFCKVTVRYCAHPDALSKAQQLILCGLFPCSDFSPKSAFTLTLLDHFNIFASLAKTSAYKFDAVITRVTNPGFPKENSGRYRELLTTHRKFNHLTNLKRSGGLFLSHPGEPNPLEQSLHCIACPRPGFNFSWDEVCVEEIPYFRHWISYDGNFRLSRKAKLADIFDISFSDGLAYFSLKGPYRKWLADVPDVPKPKGLECDNHKAGRDVNVRKTGVEETGVGACSCTSHGCLMPRGMVDFLQGERYAYGDYAIASTINHLSRGGPVTVGITYDIWCQWSVNLLARAARLPTTVAFPQDLDLVGAIPKWHLVGHKQDCYMRYSLNHTEYVGRMEGEGCERAWANLNELSGSTSEKSPGARLDAINSAACDWNFEKMIRMGPSLSSRFEEASRMYAQQHGAFQALHKSIPRKDTKMWETISTQAVKGSNGKWTSPFMDPVAEEGDFHSAVKEAREEESPDYNYAGRRPGVTRWLTDGLDLEHSMEKIQKEAKKLGGKGTPGQQGVLDDRRDRLLSRLQNHQKHREFYMPGIGEADNPSRRSTEDLDPEYGEIHLPSSYTIATLAASGLSSVANVEKKLRRATCIDALETTRNQLGAKALELKYKKANVRGEGATTRSEGILRDHNEKVARSQWRYNNSRNALLRLGMSSADSAKYLEMTKSDVKTLKSYLEDDSHGLGQGYAAISWIWRSSAVLNDDWQAIALRTEWFRSRERYKRWKEQLLLLKREMVMAARDLLKRKEIWSWKASQASCTAGMAVYATTKSNFFDKLSKELLEECGKHIEDPIVHFEWSENWYREHRKNRPENPRVFTFDMALRPWAGLEELVFGQSYEDYVRATTWDPNAIPATSTPKVIRGKKHLKMPSNSRAPSGKAIESLPSPEKKRPAQKSKRSPPKKPSSKLTKSRPIVLKSNGKRIAVYEGGKSTENSGNKVPGRPRGGSIVNRAYVLVPLPRSPSKSVRSKGE